MTSPRVLRSGTASALLARIRALAAADPDTSALCRTLLAPLEREDEDRGSDLMATLRAYYECGTRVDRTAERLFLHRNSVRYRLDRIRLLLRTDVDEPLAIAALMLALGCSSSAAAGERADAG